MQQPTQNPAQLLIWLFGVPGGIAFLTLGVKGIFFVAKASTKLDQVDALVKEIKDLRHDTRDEAQSFELSLTVIETDINSLQSHAGLAVRNYPDRRIGPPDRRSA